MIEAETPTVDIAAHPWVITATVITGIGLTILAAFPKAAGLLAETIETIVSSARRSAAATKDADVKSLRSQVDEVQAVLAETQSELRAFREETRTYQKRHDEILTTHALWDRAMIRLVIDLGGTPHPTPPLWPEAQTTIEPPGDGGTPDLHEERP